jgi:transposase
LKPILRRMWAKRGQRPAARGHHRFQWLYLYGFVHPASGEVVWYLFNTVNIEAFQATLETFAREVGASKDHIVILVLDNAGWHASPQIVPPEGIQFAFLPPYTPELQPAERLWPLANEAVANRSFTDLDTLADVVASRCNILSDDPNTIRNATLWHWWPDQPIRN